MKNTKLSQRIAMLEEMGIDTTGFNLEMNNDGLAIVGQRENKHVEDVQIKNNKLFRRWVLAQTWKMLNTTDWHGNKLSWNECLERYDYYYTFKMMVEEIRVLSKLETKDPEEFKSRSRFFNKAVVIETCKDYVKKLERKYKMLPIKNKRKEKQLRGIGRVGEERFREIVENYGILIENIAEAENYVELYVYLKRFMKNMLPLEYQTSKCNKWKEAYKGAGAYYSLKNMIMYHGVVLRGCRNKDESLRALEAETDMHFRKGEIWKLHYLMKDVIELNKFDLTESIRRNS